MTARELIQYPEAKRVTKKTLEESHFPSLLDIELLRLEETCGVCLGDFADDAVSPSPSVPDTPASEDTGKDGPDVTEIRDTEDTECKVNGGNRDPLRDIGLLTGCTHTYHFFCIEKWGKQRENTCPQCKTRFSWIGRYSRSGRRLSCCRVGLKYQKDTTEVAIADYLQHHQQQVCHVCNAVIETAREELRCSDQLCLNSFHFICAGFDALPTGTWFCPHCRANGLCRDAESRRIPASRISPEGFLLPPRARGRRAAAATGEGQEQQDRARQELIESLSNAVVRRINRSARDQPEEEENPQTAPRRRAPRGRREAAATTVSGRRGGRRQQQQQRDGDDMSVVGPEVGACLVDINTRRLGTGAAGATATGARAAVRTAVVHPDTTLDLGPPSEAPRMMRFYLRPESPPSSWLLQRKLDIIRLRQERREALRRQETLRRMEEQAKVVCSGVSIENSSGAALVEDLLQHHDQLVRMHKGDRNAHHDTSLFASQPSRPTVTTASVDNATVGDQYKQKDETPDILREKKETRSERETDGIDDGCSILASKCEELLKEEAERRSDVNDDMIRAQILLDIDRARTKFCDEATRASAHHSNNDVPRPAAERHSEVNCAPQRRDGAHGAFRVTDSPSASSVSAPQEGEAERCSMHRLETKRKRVKLKPSQALVDQVKSCMMSFMLERYPNRDDEYRSEYKRICRHISEGLTEAQKGTLLSMSEAQRSQYWQMNFVQVQTAVQDYFDRAEEPLRKGEEKNL